MFTSDNTSSKKSTGKLNMNGSAVTAAKLKTPVKQGSVAASQAQTSKTPRGRKRDAKAETKTRVKL